MMRRTAVTGLMMATIMGVAACSGQVQPQAQPAPNVQATVNAAVLATTQARAPLQPTATRLPAATVAPQATATPAMSTEAKAGVNALIDSANAHVKERQYGIALEEVRQAVGSWPEWPQGPSSLATVQAIATVGQSQLIAEATQAAATQATAQAQAAAAAATVEASKPTRLGSCKDVSGLQLCVSLNTRSRGGEYTRAKVGQEFIVFQMALTNASAQERSFNPYDWELVDGAGVVKTYDWFGGAPSNQRLESGKLIPGGKVSGLLSFQVPTGDNRFVVRYKSGLFGGSILGQWVP